MNLKPSSVVMVATLAALIAGGGVFQLSAHDLGAMAGQGRIAKAADGHYWAEAEVDGSRVRFLVDTGSSAVALTPIDAARLGIDLDALHYDRAVFTAGGGQEAATVTLDHIAVAGARVDHVKALVMKSGLPASLLGMSYLGRLSSFQATQKALVLSR